MTLGFSVGTNHDRRLWFVLILFVAAVLLPTACVLWLINDSISKQRQITRQQLADAYRSQLRLVSQKLDQHWADLAGHLESRARDRSTATAWASIVTDGSVDSVLLYGQDGRLIYPAAISPPSAVEAQSPEWGRARQLEERFTNDNLISAAAAYGDIAAKVQRCPDRRASASGSGSMSASEWDSRGATAIISGSVHRASSSQCSRCSRADHRCGCSSHGGPNYTGVRSSPAEGRRSVAPHAHRL